MSDKQIDTVLIEGLSLDASIGVFDWEKEIKQNLVFDLEIVKNFSKAAETDDINEAIDYVAVCDLIASILKEKHFQLLESLSRVISDRILESFKPDKIILTIRKPGAVPEAKSVGVKIVRERAL